MFQTLAENQGPYTYRHVGDLVQDHMQLATVLASYARVSPGKYVRHLEGRSGVAFGHAEVVIVLDRNTAISVKPSFNGAPICQPFDFSTVAPTDRFIQVLPGTAGVPSVDPFLDQSAGGDNIFVSNGWGSESKKDRRREFETRFQASINREIRHWRVALAKYGARPSAFGTGNKWICPMCPTKTCDKKQTMQRHLEIQHKIDTNGTPRNSTV